MRLQEEDKYLGAARRAPYFEGWYYRFLPPDGGAVSVIPGISKSADSHCFIEVMTQNGGSFYRRYPLSAFEYAADRFYVKIGDSVFSDAGLRLALDGRHTLSGTVLFKNAVRYPKSLRAPGIMGPFSYLPGLPCRHAVLVMQSGLEGALSFDGGEVSLSGGAGYLEKDRGFSFPESYFWVQSSRFSQSDASFMLSLAKVPLFPGCEVLGIISFLFAGGHFYNLSTYNGAGLAFMHRSKDGVTLRVHAPRYTLDLTLHPGGDTPLIAPKDGAMSRMIRESGDGRLRVTLRGTHGMLFRGESECAASEICGCLGGNA